MVRPEAGLPGPRTALQSKKLLYKKDGERDDGWVWEEGPDTPVAEKDARGARWAQQSLAVCPSLEFDISTITALRNDG